MAPRPKPTPQKPSSSSTNLVIWASDVPALKTFFPGATPLTSPPGSSGTVAVKGHTRRQYPGDTTPVSRAGGDRKTYPERWLANNTTPGTVFWCETTTTGTDGKPKTKRKQFTYQGNFGDLKALARTVVVSAYVMRNASGSKYRIAPAGGDAPEPEVADPLIEETAAAEAPIE
jgi:hypothetical protein